MPAQSFWPIQTSIYSVLASATDVTNFLKNGPNSIFDFVPDNTGFPCIVITTPNCCDEGTKEIKEIVAAVLFTPLGFPALF